MKYGFVDMTIFLSAAFGVLLSVGLSVVGIGSVAAPLAGHALLLGKFNLAWAMVTGMMFIGRQYRLTEAMEVKRARTGLYRGCPKWMRTTCYFLLSIGVFLFFLPMVLEIIGLVEKNDGSNMPSTLPGAFGIVCFTAIFAQLYSLLQTTGSNAAT